MTKSFDGSSGGSVAIKVGALRVYFVLVSLVAVPAQAGSVVAPAGYENVPGPLNNFIPFGGAFTRYQQIYGAADLQSAAGQWITAIAFRVDESIDYGGDYAGGNVAPNVRIDLSITPAPVEDLSTNLDGNHGPDRITVYDGPYIVPSLEGTMPINPFDLRFVLQTPFYYPGGNLLFDIQGPPFVPNNSFGQRRHFDAVEALDSVDRAYLDDSTGQPRGGNEDSLGLVTQFVYVPEPASATLIAMGIVAIGRRRCGICDPGRFRPQRGAA